MRKHSATLNRSWLGLLGVATACTLTFSGCSLSINAEGPTWLAQIPVGPWQFEAQWKASMSKGFSAYHSGLYTEAAVYFAQAEANARTHQLSSDKRAAALNQLGLAECMTGAYEKAETHTQLALALSEETVPPSPVNLGVGYNNLGLIADYQGNRQEAKVFYTHALKAFHTGDRQKTPALITLSTQTLINLAGLHTDEGHYQEALPLLKQAYRLNQTAGTPNRATAAILTRLGHIQFAMGNTPKALQAMREARQIYEREGHSQSEALAEISKQIDQMEAFVSHQQAPPTTPASELSQQKPSEGIPKKTG